MRDYVKDVLGGLTETPDSAGMLMLMNQLPYVGHCHYCHADPVSCLVLGVYNECMDCRVKRLRRSCNIMPLLLVTKLNHDTPEFAEWASAIENQIIDLRTRGLLAVESENVLPLREAIRSILIRETRLTC